MTAKSLTHKFVSAVADGTDPSVVKPSAWDDDHNFWLGFRTVTTTSDALTQADHWSLITCSNAGATNINVPAPTGGNFPLGYYARVRCAGVGGVTLTGTGGATINGAASIGLAQNDAVDIYGTGTTDFQAVAVRANPGVSSLNTLTGGLILAVSNTPAGSRGGLGLGTAGSTMTLSRDPPWYLENISLQASVASGVLTVNVKDAAGNAPSGSSAPRITFLDSTTGLLTTNIIAAPLSISTIVGASFGVLANNACRIWILAFDNGSGNTVLGLLVGVNAAAYDIYGSMESSNLLSSTPMSAGATSAGAIYSPAGVTVTNRPGRWLGYLEYNPADLPTPGSYPIAPRTIRLMTPLVRKPGDILQQHQQLISSVAPIQTNSITYVLTGHAANVAFLYHAANFVEVSFEGIGFITTNGDVVGFRISRGAVANAGMIGAEAIVGQSVNVTAPFNLRTLDLPNNAGAQSYALQFRNGVATNTVGYCDNTAVVIGWKEIMV